MKFKLSTAIAIIGASLLGLPVPASAAQLAGFTKNLPERMSGSGLVQKTQRRRRRRNRGGGDAGAAAAGAAIGFFGAIIAQEAARAREQRIEDCYRRYRRGYFIRDGARVYCDEL